MKFTFKKIEDQAFIIFLMAFILLFFSSIFFTREPSCRPDMWSDGLPFETAYY